ncbi:PP2C family protein-serine/threonine phosphatase [Cellvibrio japonicus]|uniref:Protein phosphatase n=1 Tax=Cellvibrio japonicus (strain Ueda107) TaxID=498211 RepID=B3PES2_CELJU|nr:PP2C family serine/threonine-protein phosphatase [Cellvibrio japonicus]ACE84294.1 protein phosphatase [Cellvibrio japonicus Ueda107]QEI12172.1 serine/threonine-protein phosphatase [Cellvibrio japonicus]QEI15746.1 serine/threonine-protein phosphatase [Cellvibrio japonicus]QEI19324.1 serine/threonine-protein phosphatase [Cellvibrio japonicus]
MATPALEYSAASHPGLVRDNNEDCFLSQPESGLWLVADGMGGHEAGEVASAIVRDTLSHRLHDNPDIPIDQAVQAAHRAILESASQGIGVSGMGSTLVALKANNNKYQVAWVGDSRAYLWTPGQETGHLEQISTDHSYVQLLVEKGIIRPEEADNHPEKNIITQCLGMQELPQVKVDVIEGQWQKNQWILLCSDGLTDEVSDKTIAQILSTAGTPNAAVDQLLHAALTSGGRDNITLQIIESPLHSKPWLDHLWPWVPYLTGRRHLDAWIFGSALAALLGLLYYVLAP